MTLVVNDFREVGCSKSNVFGTSTVASATTARQTYAVKFQPQWYI